MATVATRLRNFLLAQSTVKALVQSRISETQSPQGSGEPYIVLRRESSENADVLDGAVGDGPLNYGMAIECVSQQESQANAVADAVRGVLHLYRGAFDDTTAKGCFVDTESLEAQQLVEGGDRFRFTRTLNTRIFL